MKKYTRDSIFASIKGKKRKLKHIDQYGGPQIGNTENVLDVLTKMVHSHDLLTNATFHQLNSAKKETKMTEYPRTHVSIAWNKGNTTPIARCHLTAHVKRRLTLALSRPVLTNYKEKSNIFKNQIIKNHLRITY